MPKITLCSKICRECGFSKIGTQNTLYAEAIEVINQGILFPCHMYLRSQTGDESRGTELLSEVKVCRGYVAYMSLYAPKYITAPAHWQHLIAELTYDDLKVILRPDDLYDSHIGLREGIFLNNPIGSKPHEPSSRN